jgi:hypothetical protein
MATGPKLDGAGTIKLVTLDEALLKLQSVHALVERMAVEQKAGKPINGMEQQLKRIATPLQSQLKSQFSLIADLVTAMLLIAGRGGPAQLKVRSFREIVGQMRTQMEIAIVQTKAKHAVASEAPQEKS